MTRTGNMFVISTVGLAFLILATLFMLPRITLPKRVEYAPAFNAVAVKNQLELEEVITEGLTSNPIPKLDGLPEEAINWDHFRENAQRKNGARGVLMWVAWSAVNNINEFKCDKTSLYFSPKKNQFLVDCLLNSYDIWIGNDFYNHGTILINYAPNSGEFFVVTIIPMTEKCFQAHIKNNGQVYIGEVAF